MMLEYRSEQKFNFKETDYISGPNFLLKDVQYHKENRENLVSPSQTYNIYKHDNLDPIGKATITFIDNADEVLQGVITFKIFNPKPDMLYAYHIIRLLKEVARSYDINVVYYLPTDGYEVKQEELDKLNAQIFIEDGVQYYKIKVERF